MYAQKSEKQTLRVRQYYYFICVLYLTRDCLLNQLLDSPGQHTNGKYFWKTETHFLTIYNLACN